MKKERIEIKVKEKSFARSFSATDSAIKRLLRLGKSKSLSKALRYIANNYLPE